jgi:hypothetical protein
MGIRLLCGILGLIQLLLAQSAAPPQPSAPGGEPARLRILVLRGEGARHSIRSKLAVQSLIEVRGENDKPVPGAQVVFQLPSSGPGGTFPGGRLIQRTASDVRGQAATAGFVPNDQEGRFELKVSVSSGAATASAVIAQANAPTTVLDVKKPSKKRWLLLVLAAGGAGGVIAATRGGGGGAAAVPTPTITLVPGPVTVGGPR